jgi:hypothetical protein
MDPTGMILLYIGLMQKNGSNIYYACVPVRDYCLLASIHYNMALVLSSQVSLSRR